MVYSLSSKYSSPSDSVIGLRILRRQRSSHSCVSFSPEPSIVGRAGADRSGGMASLIVKVVCSKAPWCEPEILESLLDLAVQIAHEGREGRRVGALFTLGNAAAVLSS